jgi:sulfate permease, SulP family
MKIVNPPRFDNIRGDIYGGLTAAVVALPLALAFGVASGAGPMAGLYGAIIVGFFASLFGGTPSQISGPTGPMTVVMALIVTQYAGHPGVAFTVVMMGGLFQILFGILRLGQYISLVPFTVISGFMSGIGVIIIILQLPQLMGHPAPSGGIIGAIGDLPSIAAAVNWQAFLGGAVALAIVIFTPPRISRKMPSPLIALVAGTTLVWLMLPGAPILGDIPTGLPALQAPAFSWTLLPEMIVSALILALLGTIDSLLTSLIADNITRTHHEPERELVGQGIGNLVAGLFGAIPGAGATMRTVVNIRAGGLTALSGMIHALVLLAVVLGLGPLAGHIPHAVLAGILIKVGFDIIDWSYLRKVHRAPRIGVVLMFVVLGLTVFVDLIIAVTVGIIAASLLFVKRMSDLQLQNIQAADGTLGEVPMTADERDILDRHPRSILLYSFSGPVSFGAAKGMTKKLLLGEHRKVLILDLSDVTHIDTSGAFAIEDIIVKARDLSLPVYLVGMRAPVQDILHRLGVLDLVSAEHRHVTRLAALRTAAETISDAS